MTVLFWGNQWKLNTDWILDNIRVFLIFLGMIMIWSYFLKSPLSAKTDVYRGLYRCSEICFKIFQLKQTKKMDVGWGDETRRAELWQLLSWAMNGWVYEGLHNCSVSLAYVYYFHNEVFKKWNWVHCISTVLFSKRLVFYFLTLKDKSMGLYTPVSKSHHLWSVHCIPTTLMSYIHLFT